MCVAFLALDRHPRWRVVLATNRDETYARPTTPAHRWDDAPEVIAGRDDDAGGTWCGVRDGDLAWTLVTNVRDLPAHRDDALSRGDLTRAYLRLGAPPEVVAQDVHARRQRYNPFNLLLAQGDEVWYVSTHTSAPRRIGPGLYGLSNATLDVPWPKVTRGKQALAACLADPRLGPDPLFDLLDHAEPAPEAELPDTGVGREWERILSPIFIASERYGTRAQSVLLLDAEGQGVFAERTTTPGASREVRTFTLGSRETAATP
ncbi:MAG: NRDE family protein [Bacteroidota bacterium]